jgi:hypothetical protein
VATMKERKEMKQKINNLFMIERKKKKKKNNNNNNLNIK